VKNLLFATKPTTVGRVKNLPYRYRYTQLKTAHKETTTITMTEEKILTLHPQGKSGRTIARQKYDTLKTALLAALQARELTHPELMSQLQTDLESSFSGNIGWYAETVKLDLEARGLIERTATKPQKYRLKTA
jgi:hypothetical protein